MSAGTCGAVPFNRFTEREHRARLRDDARQRVAADRNRAERDKRALEDLEQIEALVRGLRDLFRDGEGGEDADGR